MPSITWFKNGVEMKNNKDQNQITVNTNKQKEQVQQLNFNYHKISVITRSNETSKLMIIKVKCIQNKCIIQNDSFSKTCI